MNGNPCLDINECATNNGACFLLYPNFRAQCTNTPGSRVCGACPTGFSGNGITCTDINECVTGNGGCNTLTKCTNTIGSRTCGSCPNGYIGNGVVGCTDINECACSNGGCSPLATCTNTPGSRVCGPCPAGYGAAANNQCVPRTALSVVQVRVVNALTNAPVRNIWVHRRPGIGNTLSSSVQDVLTNANGIAIFSNLQLGCYTFHTSGESVLVLIQWWERRHDNRGRCDRHYEEYNPLYHHAKRTVCVDGTARTYTSLLPIVPRCGLQQLRAVLTWNPLPLDLDLSVVFQTTSQVCMVGYFDTVCENVQLNCQNSQGGDVGVETITINIATQTVFQFSVNLFGALLPNLYQSGAQIEVYSYAGDYPIATFNVPVQDPFGHDLAQVNRWWNVFCLDGRNALQFNSVTPLQFFSSDRYAYTRNCTLLQWQGQR